MLLVIDIDKETLEKIEDAYEDSSEKTVRAVVEDVLNRFMCKDCFRMELFE